MGRLYLDPFDLCDINSLYELENFYFHQDTFYRTNDPILDVIVVDKNYNLHIGLLEKLVKIDEKNNIVRDVVVRIGESKYLLDSDISRLYAMFILDDLY